LLFSVTALIVVGFSVGGGGLSPRAQAALLWVVLFFAAFSGLAHIFLHEEEAGTSMALRLSTAPAAVYFGKLLFNLILLFAISTIVVPLYVLMLGVLPVKPVGFGFVIVFGGFGLGGAATIVAAIIGKARGKGALYGALGFPILLPLLFMAVDATYWTLVPDVGPSGLSRDITGLISFAVMIVTASWLLFPVIWED
jgi:heme exporter protein B